MGRAGCLAGESSDDYSQPAVRAGLGKAASEHPTFLRWDHGLHPRLQGQAHVFRMDFASLKDGRLEASFIPWTAKSTSAWDTGTLCASPSGKEVVMWEQHPSLQPAHAGLRGEDMS